MNINRQLRNNAHITVNGPATVTKRTTNNSPEMWCKTTTILQQKVYYPSWLKHHSIVCSGSNVLHILNVENCLAVVNEHLKSIHGNGTLLLFSDTLDRSILNKRQQIPCDMTEFQVVRKAWRGI
jgi:hypothetical protein